MGCSRDNGQLVDADGLSWQEALPLHRRVLKAVDTVPAPPSVGLWCRDTAPAPPSVGLWCAVYTAPAPPFVGLWCAVYTAPAPPSVGLWCAGVGRWRGVVQGSAGSSRLLSFKDRLKAALGAAQGLAFLHAGCGRRIIYRDFKTSNILVDKVRAHSVVVVWFGAPGVNSGWKHEAQASVFGVFLSASFGRVLLPRFHCSHCSHCSLVTLFTLFALFTLCTSPFQGCRR